MASVIEQVPFARYTGNGLATVYAYEFELLQAADMVVSIDGVEQPDSLYTLAGVGVQDGGTVTFLAPPANGADVLLQRLIKLERLIDYQNNGDLQSPVLNLDFKRLWQAAQQLRAAGIGGLRAPFPEILDELPAADNRRGLQLLFHPITGQPFLAAPVSGSAADVMLQYAGTDDGQGLSIVGYDPSKPATDGAAEFFNRIYARTAAEVSAGVTPTAYQYRPSDPRRYGAVFDNSTDETAEIASAFTVAGQTVAGAQGSEVPLPQGTAIVSASQNLSNRVALVGQSKRGSVLKAAAGHSGPYMLTVINGTSSMFDNRCERLTLDCNNVNGLGGVISDAWQEGGGLRDVLINNLRGAWGLRVQSGFGGAALLEISQSEIFGSAVGAGLGGIYVPQISLTGNFTLIVGESTIAGGVGQPFPVGIKIDNDSSVMRAVHFETCTSGVLLDGVGNHVLAGVTGGPGVTNVVEIAATFTGTLTMLGCHRSGATNLLKDNRSGGLGTITSQDPGFIRIDTSPALHAGATIANGNLNGVSVTVTSAFGVSSFVRTGGGPVGDYTITLSTTLQSANDLVPTADSNLAGGRTTKDVLGTNSFRIRTYDAAGALTDSNQISFQVTRVK